jgi:hypothetical protein
VGELFATEMRPKCGQTLLIQPYARISISLSLSHLDGRKEVNTIFTLLLGLLIIASV